MIYNGHSRPFQAKPWLPPPPGEPGRASASLSISCPNCRPPGIGRLLVANQTWCVNTLRQIGALPWGGRRRSTTFGLARLDFILCAPPSSPLARANCAGRVVDVRHDRARRSVSALRALSLVLRRGWSCIVRSWERFGIGREFKRGVTASGGGPGDVVAERRHQRHMPQRAGGGASGGTRARSTVA